MNPTNRTSTHPGEMLWEEFLLPKFAGDVEKLAEALSKEWGNSKEFWLNLARTHEETKENRT